MAIHSTVTGFPLKPIGVIDSLVAFCPFEDAYTQKNVNFVLSYFHLYVETFFRKIIKSYPETNVDVKERSNEAFLYFVFKFRQAAT